MMIVHPLRFDTNRQGLYRQILSLFAKAITLTR